MTLVLESVLAEVWRFVRGDTDVPAFERWVYENTEALSSRLEPKAFHVVLSADYRSPGDARAVRDIFREYAIRASSLPCRCVTLCNCAVVDMGEDGQQCLASVERRYTRGEPLWWLWAGECTRCGQWWLVGQEERQNDVFCLRRMSSSEVQNLAQGQWPREFDTYEFLLQLSKEAGHRVDFVDPENAKSLRWTIVDLAHARPGIRSSELASLLNLDPDLAAALARRAMLEDNVEISIDAE
jgi:hypothetical protein